jgi:hypothetical protein
MSYIYSNDRLQSVYLRDVHVGTKPQICSSATLECNTSLESRFRKVWQKDPGYAIAVMVFECDGNDIPVLVTARWPDANRQTWPNI